MRTTSRPCSPHAPRSSRFARTVLACATAAWTASMALSAGAQPLATEPAQTDARTAQLAAIPPKPPVKANPTYGAPLPPGTTEDGTTTPPGATLPDATLPDATLPDATLPDAEATHAGPAAGDRPGEPPTAKTVEAKKPAWYERLNIRGYTQVRYNRLYVTNDDLRNEQGDRSIGSKNGFLIRRARVILYGDVHDHVFVYLQPDFASSAGDTGHVAQLRDWYADLSIDKKKEFRFRVGQSKVPFGWENMQSSQNRIPLDRSDPINSAVVNERDLGVFFYWATDTIRKRFKYLVDSGLKGSGDYGIIGLGAYNGQTANQRERNDNRHVVAHATYPFQLGEQFVEIGADAYSGVYTVKKDENIQGGSDFRDIRAAAHVIVYPQPIGFQLEYNVGRGPELVGNTIQERPLHGGYAMLTAKLGPAIPYVRVSYYDGAKKHENNAPRHEVREVEGGVEWHFNKSLELVTAFMASNRTVNGDKQVGELVRLQLQFNY